MLPSSYVILLTVAFLAVCVYLRSSHDIPFTLAALTAVVCFFWGFALAPWGIQLLIVVLLTQADKFYVPKERRLG
jgi:hypothetical protein